PAPEPQLDDDNSPAVYHKDMDIYSRNAFYPAMPYQMSEPMTVRGVQMVEVGVMPFQYNPVTKELIVYEDLELELNIEGGNGTYGDIRYRTPEWDQILGDMILNHEVLPKVDYGAKYRKHYESRETGCEYIIITPDNEDFVQLADSIKQFRTEQGIPTEVFTVSQCGGNTGQAIRNFIRNAYNNWDMPPAAVLILGDHDSDPEKGVVSYTMNNHPGGGGYNPYISDHAYAVMGNNHMPEIILARITGRDYEELYHIIKKDLDYERTPPTNPGFYNHPITAMGFQLERWFQLCSEIVNGFWEHELGKEPVRINAIYEGNPGSRWSTYDNTNTVVNYFGPNGCGYIPSNMSHLTDWSGTGNKVNEAINNGAFILQHRDHGAEELWGEPSYSIGYIKRLVNPDLTFVMSCNCLTGRFNYGGLNSEGCFAEVFHRHQHGALGLIAATQVSYSFVNDVYVWGMYDNMWPDFMPTYGTQHETNFIRPAFGNAAGKYFLRQSSWTDDYVKEITYYLFHHHGDAYMSLYSEVPQPLDVEMIPVLVAGTNRYQISVDEGATICLSVNDQIIGFDYGTGQTQNVIVTPQVPGTVVKLTITKQNYYRYEHLLTTIPAEGPYLIFDAVQVNDHAGNGNQAIDYNETCDLMVSIHNVGSESIGNISATLSSHNPKIEILQGQTSFGTINSDGLLQANNAFTVHFDETIEDQENIRVYLQMSNNDHSYLDSIDLRINAPVLNCTNVHLTTTEGEPTDRFFQGETAMMVFDITNSGHSRSLDLTNQLRFKAPFLDITENPLPLDALEAGETAQVTFQVNLHENAPKGNFLDYVMETQSGVRSIQFESRASLGYTTEDFEDEELNSNIQWNMGTGPKKWHIVEDATATEGYCLRSPELSDNGSGKLTIGFKSAQPETFTFSYKTSTEEGDALELVVNNDNVGSWSGISDGWEQVTVNLREGQNLIRFTYKKNAQGSAGEDCVMVDHLLFPPTEELYIFAGDDAESCSDEVFTPNSCVLFPKEILWSTSGDGTFDDPTLETPGYSFGVNDIANGQVMLSLTATDANDAQQSDDITITVNEGLSDFTPEMPVGETLIDTRVVTQSVYQAEMETTADFIWALDPEEAGTLSTEGHQATVSWNSNFRGTAHISYQLRNECSESESSAALAVSVVNSTSIDESSTTSLEVFPNPASDRIEIRASQLGDGIVVIRIVNPLGRTVYSTQKNVNAGVIQETLNTTTLRSGLYDLQVIDGNHIHNTRIIIK
nr:T9SS type A sorting domain-containing protein [Bacteroidales bacterium]